MVRRPRVGPLPCRARIPRPAAARVRSDLESAPLEAVVRCAADPASARVLEENSPAPPAPRSDGRAPGRSEAEARNSAGKVSRVVSRRRLRVGALVASCGGSTARRRMFVLPPRLV
jgi:hypothetical protein